MTDEYLIQQDLVNFLAESFRNHSVECEIKDDLLIFHKQRMTADARLFDKSSSATFLFQLDVKLEIGLGKEIVESCVGFGNSAETAIAEAKKNFLRNSFHVLLSAFFSPDYDDEVSKQKWIVGGRSFDVTMSNISIRGKRLDPFPTKWMDQFDEMVKQQQLSEGIHWIRLYYAQSQREMMVSEILLDNDVWESVVPTVRSFDYPKASDFFSLRIFLVLQGGLDVSRAAATMAWMVDEDDEKIEQQLVDDGWSQSDAEKAIMFIPLAFGRVFLKGLTTSKFSDTAVIIDDAENKTEISLAKEPIYTAAYQLAEHIMIAGCMNKNHSTALFIQSSEFNAYNNALKEGAKPEDLDGAEFGSPIIYMQHYQPAKEHVSAALDVNIEKEEPKKNTPFWMFWKK